MLEKPHQAGHHLAADCHSSARGACRSSTCSNLNKRRTGLSCSTSGSVRAEPAALAWTAFMSTQHDAPTTPKLILKLKRKQPMVKRSEVFPSRFLKFTDLGGKPRDVEVERGLRRKNSVEAAPTRK